MLSASFLVCFDHILKVESYIWLTLIRYLWARLWIAALVGGAGSLKKKKNRPWQIDGETEIQNVNYETALVKAALEGGAKFWTLVLFCFVLFCFLLTNNTKCKYLNAQSLLVCQMTIIKNKTIAASWDQLSTYLCLAVGAGPGIGRAVARRCAFDWPWSQLSSLPHLLSRQICERRI